MIFREIEFCSHAGNLSLVRRFVREFLTEQGCSATQMDLMVLGLDEACTNVIRYAYRCESDQLMRLKLECAGGVVRCRLRDYGHASDPSQMNGRALEVVRPGGLGMHLIRHAFDNAYYVRRPKGTELVLVKSLVADPASGADHTTRAA